jgi:hypothetical protein
MLRNTVTTAIRNDVVATRTSALNIAKTILNGLVETGKICSVTAITNSGKVVKFHGRVGVTKYLKNNDKTKPRSKATSDNYILFYDFQKQGYRNIARNRIVSVNAHTLKIEH